MLKKLFLLILISSGLRASEGVMAHSPRATDSSVNEGVHTEKENEKSYTSLSMLIEKKQYASAAKLLEYILENINNPRLEQDKVWYKSIKKDVQRNLERLSALRQVIKEQKNLFIMLVRAQIALQDCLPDSVISNMQDKKFPQTMRKAFSKLNLHERYMILANNEEMSTISTKKQKPMAKAAPAALVKPAQQEQVAVAQPAQPVQPALAQTFQDETLGLALPVAVASENVESASPKVARRLSFSNAPTETPQPLPEHEVAAMVLIPGSPKTEIKEHKNFPDEKPVVKQSSSPIKRLFIGSVCLAVLGVVTKKIYNSRAAKNS